MPIIPPLAQGILQGKVDADVIYKESVYNPNPGGATVPPLTFELLNGGLTRHNYTDSDHQIEAQKVQIGTFAQGYYHGFNRNDFMLAEQCFGKTTITGGDDVATERKIHSSLSCSVYIPFKPSLILFGFQAMFCHDAGHWVTGSTGLNQVHDWWDLMLQAGNNPDQNTHSVKYYQKLPNTMYITKVKGSVEYNNDDYYAFSDEDSWRYISRQGQLDGGAVSAGYFTARVTVGALSRNDDIRKAKLQTPSGAIWVLALR